MQATDPVIATLRLALVGGLGALAACGNSGSSGSDGGKSADPTASPVSPTTPSPPASGYTKRADGRVLRHGPATCDASLGARSCAGTETKLNCKSDGDCKDGRFGVCRSHEAQAALTSRPSADSFCACAYGCSEDRDCAPGELCVCGDMLGTVSMCVPASCGSDADCPGGACAVSSYNDGCGMRRFVACTSSSDACQSDADCSKDERGRDTRCVYDDDRGKKGSWACRGGGCQVGRPLVVEGSSRTAPTRSRADWQAPMDEAELAASADAATRARVATHWLSIAALEHASVASFARFSLQLLSLGAPAELLVATHAAALDEIEHAKLAYGIASAYGRPTLGPAELPAAVAPLESDLAAIVAALVVEGCLGETYGAAEAAVLAERAGGAELRATLRRIAADELRHAGLAYRALRWLVATHGDEAREAARGALEPALRELASGRVAFAEQEDLSAHGVLGPAEASDLQRRVLGAVILDAMREVLDGAATVAS